MTADHALTGWLLSNDASDPFAWVASLTRRPSWHSDAACRGAGTAAFFPSRGANAATMDRARAVCELLVGLPDINVLGVVDEVDEMATR